MAYSIDIPKCWHDRGSELRMITLNSRCRDMCTVLVFIVSWWCSYILVVVQYNYMSMG